LVYNNGSFPGIRNRIETIEPAAESVVHEKHRKKQIIEPSRKAIVEEFCSIVDQVAEGREYFYDRYGEG
jgi:hypothetical protein